MIKELTENARRYLSRRMCWLCDQPLSRDDCGAIYEKCTVGIRNLRRETCLAEYKPRKRPMEEK